MFYGRGVLTDEKRRDTHRVSSFCFDASWLGQKTKVFLFSSSLHLDLANVWSQKGGNPSVLLFMQLR